jgi:hypothetical protein
MVGTIMEGKRATLFVAILLVAMAGLLQAPPAVAQSGGVVCNTTKQGTPITPALLTSGLPCQVEAVAPFTLDHLQDAFDFYSWLTFVALNSPASGGKIGKDAPAVWESWKNIFAVIVPPGQTPTPWGQPGPIPTKCQTVPHTEHEPVLRMVGKTPDLLTAVNQPFDTGPLIDQHGRYVHYEILINQPMFDFIVANKLYSRAGQAAFTDKVDFEGGSDNPAAIGGIMVKAAWKVLGPGDDPGQFHTETALLYQPAIANPPIAESCRAARVGLVGLHIAHKTTTDPQWLWSTFEPVANAPSQADIDAKKLLKHYNFYNAACPPNKCAVNQPPPRPWNPDVEPFPGGYHSQVIRVIPITAATAGLSAQFQALLKGTVWASYALISTQWPTNAASKTDPTGAPAPQFLANTTMETYVQGRVPISSSSCIACHNNAADTQGKFSDFTYILERAQ